MEVTYVDFYMYGPATYWYENGQLSASGNYTHCSEDGLWTYYYENGNKKMEGSFINGQRDGIWIFYKENGKQEKTVRYRGGEETK